MRSPDALERLAVARPVLPSALADRGEEDRILERILASDRRPVRGAGRRATLALVGVAVLGAASLAASLEIDNGNRPTTVRTGGQDVGLTGERIRMAGYRFRTPAGFKQSTSSCISAPVADRPRPALDGFAGAASADGGCLEAVLEVPGSSGAPAPIPQDAAPVSVGSYQGYFVIQGSSGDALYVALPHATTNQGPAYLVLFAQGLTEQQLVAVAVSGLSTSPPPGPTPTTGTETTG